MLKIQKFTFSPFAENTYLLFDDSQECVIIDPGCYTDDERQTLRRFIQENGLQPKRLLQTHTHADHLFGCAFVHREYGLGPEFHRDELPVFGQAAGFARSLGIELENPPQPDGFLKEGDVVEFGKAKLHIMVIPGHSPGGLLFYSPAAKVILSGDVLFAGSIGRTDLPGGDYKQIIKGIKSKLLTLDGSYNVFPGHGASTTIAAETKNNFFLQ